MNPSNSDVHQAYSDALTVREARRAYFERNGIPLDGGYSQKWVRISVFGLFGYWMPNPPARKVAVPYHDLNHVLSEYPATVRGECIVAGYEVGSGIDRYWLGWLISSQAMVLGLLVCPTRVFRAYVRGRRSRSTYAIELDDAALDKTLGELRRELEIPPPEAAIPASAGDVASFAAHCTATILGHLLPPLGVVGLVWRARKRRTVEAT